MGLERLDQDKTVSAIVVFEMHPKAFSEKLSQEIYDAQASGLHVIDIHFSSSEHHFSALIVCCD